MNKIAVLISVLSMPLFGQPTIWKPEIVEKYWCPVGHFNADQAKLLSLLSSELQPQYVLEIGFCTGRSAVSILLSCTPIKFISIDINLDYRKKYGRQYAHLLQNDFQQFRIIEEDSKKILKESFFKSHFAEGLDWVTVDGDHSYAGCLFDLMACAKWLNPSGIIAIDDYKSGPPNGVSLPDVTRAVNVFLKNHSDFFKLEWNVQGKGIALLCKNKSMRDRIKSIIK